MPRRRSRRAPQAYSRSEMRAGDPMVLWRGHIARPLPGAHPTAQNRQPPAARWLRRLPGRTGSGQAPVRNLLTAPPPTTSPAREQKLPPVALPLAPVGPRAADAAQQGRVPPRRLAPECQHCAPRLRSNSARRPDRLPCTTLKRAVPARRWAAGVHSDARPGARIRQSTASGPLFPLRNQGDSARTWPWLQQHYISI